MRSKIVVDSRCPLMRAFFFLWIFCLILNITFSYKKQIEYSFSLRVNLPIMQELHSEQ